MSTIRRRGLIRAVALAIAAAAVAVAAGVASAHSSPATHHALADNGVVNSRN
jgi:hypothetical protein